MVAEGERDSSSDFNVETVLVEVVLNVPKELYTYVEILKQEIQHLLLITVMQNNFNHPFDNVQFVHTAVIEKMIGISAHRGIHFSHKEAESIYDNHLYEKESSFALAL